MSQSVVLEEKERRCKAMNNSFVNIGNKAFVQVSKIICIEAADSDKARRILARANLKRTSPEVIDTTSANETRSIIFLKDNAYCISSVNASVLAKRAQNGISELVDEK